MAALATRPPAWAASPPPLPQQNPTLPGGSKVEVGSKLTSPHPFIPTPCPSGLSPCQTPPEGGRSLRGVRSWCPVVSHPRHAAEREAGLPQPPGTMAVPGALLARCGAVPGMCSAAY